MRWPLGVDFVDVASRPGVCCSSQRRAIDIVSHVCGTWFRISRRPGTILALGRWPLVCSTLSSRTPTGLCNAPCRSGSPCFDRVSNLVSAQAVRRLGLRRSLFLGSLTYVAFVTANAFYRPWFVYLSSALLGFGAALLWTAQGSFVVRCSRADDHLNRKVPGSSLGKFNGVFFALFQANQFLGNALVAIMFNYNESPATIFTVRGRCCPMTFGM